MAKINLRDDHLYKLDEKAVLRNYCLPPKTYIGVAALDKA